MQCPKCGSNDTTKAGIRYGGGKVRQRWVCKSCARHFFTEIRTITQPDESIRTRKELDDSLTKLNRHVKGATRELKKNVRIGT